MPYCLHHGTGAAGSLSHGDPRPPERIEAIAHPVETLSAWQGALIGDRSLSWHRAGALTPRPSYLFFWARLLLLRPGLVGIEGRHTPRDLGRLGAEILLVDDAVLIDDEGHDP